MTKNGLRYRSKLFLGPLTICKSDGLDLNTSLLLLLLLLLLLFADEFVFWVLFYQALENSTK